jgi:hypothetical protein
LYYLSPPCCAAAGPASPDTAVDDRDSIYYYDDVRYPAVSACMPPRDRHTGNPWWDEIRPYLSHLWRFPGSGPSSGTGEGDEGYDLPFWWWEVLESHVS